MGKKQTKLAFAYFTDIHEQMLKDESKSFWDLVPVKNTMFGRTISHALFRTMGLDISKYFADKAKTGETLPRVTETLTNMAEVEFLMAWNQNIALVNIQNESLAFRELLLTRDYQLWLVQALARIPESQWDRNKSKYTSVCENILYIVAYRVWSAVLHSKKVDSVLESLPCELTVLEKYLISELVNDYSLDETCQERITSLSKTAKEYGYTGMHYTQNRLHQMFGINYKEISINHLGLDADGTAYFTSAAVLWGLWFDSVKEMTEKDGGDFLSVLPCMIHTIIMFIAPDVFNRLRLTYLQDWSNRHKLEIDSGKLAVSVSAEEVESELAKEVEKLKKELSQSQKEVEIATSKLNKEQKRCTLLTDELTGVKSRNAELSSKLDELTKKVSQQDKPVKVKVSKEDASMKALEKKVLGLASDLTSVSTRINDLYALLTAEDEEIDTEDAAENSDGRMEFWEACATEFTGKLVLCGGTKAWQERISQWFENRDIKVRTYMADDIVVGLRSQDTVIVNIVDNKHKYTVPFMNAARDAGARLHISYATNVEQTLRILFEGNKRK